MPATPQPSDDDNYIFFQVSYHPDDPSWKQSQKQWSNCLAAPHYSIPLPDLSNQDGDPIGLSHMTVCYNRQLNLGNLLSYQKLIICNGPQVSSYQITNLMRAIEREQRT
jgi:hypothetical protein